MVIRSGLTSSQELVDSGVSAVLRAINAGYKPENITIAGHSLGGAVSALVLQEMKNHLKPDEKFACYINHKSFKDLGAILAAWAKSAQDGWLRKTINATAWAFRVQLDAESAIKSGLPVNKIVAYYGGKRETPSGELYECDYMINEDASIGKALENKQISTFVETIVNKTSCDHHENRSQTIYGGEDSEKYKEYIQKTTTAKLLIHQTYF